MDGYNGHTMSYFIWICWSIDTLFFITSTKTCLTCSLSSSISSYVASSKRYFHFLEYFLVTLPFISCSYINIFSVIFLTFSFSRGSSNSSSKLYFMSSSSSSSSIVFPEGSLTGSLFLVATCNSVKMLTCSSFGQNVVMCSDVSLWTYNSPSISGSFTLICWTEAIFSIGMVVFVFLTNSVNNYGMPGW